MRCVIVARTSIRRNLAPATGETRGDALATDETASTIGETER
ncbi:hypothetical protein BURCENBC7_AP3320 [Burkholderia cenocepacia BC7]|nr:hypothetical protein BURCENBC7_AP3320 [Burkholderia cenocepacia BC7]